MKLIRLLGDACEAVENIYQRTTLQLGNAAAVHRLNEGDLATALGCLKQLPTGNFRLLENVARNLLHHYQDGPPEKINEEVTEFSEKAKKILSGEIEEILDLSSRPRG